jgi:glycosyltransferase involved in cell wall biosynthesis
MNILWHHRPRYNSPETSGANVRLLNLAKELEKQGHRVYLLLDDLPSDDVSSREAFIEQVKKDTSISGVFHFRFSSPYNRIMGAMVRKLLHPALVNAILGRYHLRMSKQVLDLIDSLKIDAFITSLRDRLWLLPFLKRRVVIVVDWCDSGSLASVRRLKLSWKQKVARGSVATVKEYTLATVQEAYYGRRADLNLLASPIDAAWLTRLSRAPEKTHVVLNGAVAASRTVPKVAKRLIFSGRMDFPPNHEAALWFIDRVLPLVVQRDPTVKLVIAGADPLPELCARASAHVSIVGFVKDVATEIAASELYVAPMITGSGFKNKVAEALVNGTFVVGTSLAFEFLSEEFREMLPVGDTAEELANQVLHFLSDPSLFSTNLNRLQILASQRFRWKTQAEMLARLIRMVTDGRPSQRRALIR